MEKVATNYMAWPYKAIIDGKWYLLNNSTKKKLEHRHMVEDEFGDRYIKNKIVWHKDRNHLNNKLSNLEVITRSECGKRLFQEQRIKAKAHNDKMAPEMIEAERKCQLRKKQL